MQLGDQKPGSEPTEIPSQDDITWYCGIYEGEGTCFQSQSGCPQCRIVQKDPELLYNARNLFGGVVRSYIRKKDNRTYYYWIISGKRAADFLMLVLQHPRTTARRKAQINKVLEPYLAKSLQKEGSI
jgi:hypothetical protein